MKQLDQRAWQGSSCPTPGRRWGRGCHPVVAKDQHAVLQSQGHCLLAPPSPLSTFEQAAAWPSPSLPQGFSFFTRGNAYPQRGTWLRRAFWALRPTVIREVIYLGGGPSFSPKAGTDPYTYPAAGVSASQGLGLRCGPEEWLVHRAPSCLKPCVACNHCGIPQIWGSWRAGGRATGAKGPSLEGVQESVSGGSWALACLGSGPSFTPPLPASH